MTSTALFDRSYKCFLNVIFQSIPVNLIQTRFQCNNSTFSFIYGLDKTAQLIFHHQQQVTANSVINSYIGKLI